MIMTYEIDRREEAPNPTTRTTTRGRRHPREDSRDKRRGAVPTRGRA